MNSQVSHQATWKKSVTEVYRAASIPFEWSMTLVEECQEAGIDYFSSPYDFNAIDFLDKYVPAYKAGSGEIDWIEALERMASKGKPFFVATGESTIGEVQKAVHAVLKINRQLVLMQCKTADNVVSEWFSGGSLANERRPLSPRGDAARKAELRAGARVHAAGRAHGAGIVEHGVHGEWPDRDRAECFVQRDLERQRQHQP